MEDGRCGHLPGKVDCADSASAVDVDVDVVGMELSNQYPESSPLSTIRHYFVPYSRTNSVHREKWPVVMMSRLMYYCTLTSMVMLKKNSHRSHWSGSVAD